jgi:hypothetical protein
MLVSSTVTGDRCSGSIVVTHDGLTFGYAYRRGTGPARHDLTVWPEGGAFAASPRLSDMLADVAIRSAEGGVGSYVWRVDEQADGWTLTAIGVAA